MSSRREAAARPRARLAAGVALALALGGGRGAALDVVPGATPEPVAERPAAVVNGVPIAASELETLVAAQVRRQEAGEGSETPAAIRRTVLDSLIDVELLFQAATAAGLLPSPARVALELDKQRAQYHDAGAFRAALAADRITEAELTERLRRQLAVSAWLEREIEAKVTVDEAACRAYYASHRDEMTEPEQLVAEQVFVPALRRDSAAERAEALKKAEAVLEQVRAGEDFAALAARAAAEAGTAPRVLLVRGEADAVVERAVFPLEVGAMSHVIATDRGYYVMRVIEKAAARERPFEEVKDAIEARLVEQGRAERAKSVLAELRRRARIELAPAAR